jgi:hypothetical protein
MSTEIRAGSDVIRRALAALNKKVHIAALARDLNLSPKACRAGWVE